LTTPASTCDWMPQRIGKYEVESELGHGGFGRVFRAMDPDVKRLVAVKILAIGKDTELNSRFRYEAKAAGNLHHKNIVTIYEYGEADGTPYIAMEFLEGETLEQIIKKNGPLPLANKMRIMSEVAEGLHHAHEHGVVHRDVKPANIIVLPGGGVKILDFGIARLVRKAASRETAPAEFLAGTLRYMSPEQFEGREADALSDLFSYAIIYYELLTGKHPFDADDAPAIMYKIRCEEPDPLRGEAPECPEALAQILRRALEKQRERRYPNLEDLRLDAEPVLMDLERQRAETLLAEADSLVAADRLDEAKALLREVADLDPANRVARQMRVRVRQYEQERALRQRINTLVKDGEEKLRERQYDEAIALLESALECDSKDDDVTLRLERAKTLRERASRVEKMKADARAARDRGELTLALRSAAEVLQLESSDEEAKALLAEIQSAIGQREAEKRRREQLDHAKGLMLLGEFDAALEAIEEIPGERTPELEEMVAAIHTQQQERERRRKLAEELTGIRNLLGRFRFDEALPWLESLAAEWPEEEEPQKLLTYAKQEAGRQQRAKAISDLTGRVKALLAKKDFDRAIQILEEAGRSFQDAGLAQLLKAATDEKAAAEREKALREATERIQQLRENEKFAEALRLAEDSLREFGSVAEIEQLSRQLAEEWERQKGVDAVRRSVESAKDLIGHGHARSAISLLKRLEETNPGSDEISALLESAAKSLTVQEQARAVDKLHGEAQAYVDSAEYEPALKVLATALEQYPGEERLLARQRATEEAKAEQEREHAIQRGLRQCERFRQETRFTEALELIDKMIAEYGERSQLRTTRSQLLLELELRRVEEEEKERMEAARIAGEEAREIGEVLAAAHELQQKGEARNALQILELAVLRYPGAADLSRAEEQLRSKIASSERRSSLNRLKLEIDIYLRGRQFNRALATLERAEREFPEETAWAELRGRAMSGESTTRTFAAE